jgi:catechol 2,3-dioxygenase-like lactoylglutathione lyase family enzyme
MGTHHIGITVANLEKALAFWAERVASLLIHDGATLEILQPVSTEPAPR